MSKQRIGLIDAGQMATALAQGLIEAGLTTADRLLASHVDPHERQWFAKGTAAPTATAPDNIEAATRRSAELGMKDKG
jgi:pyrroline-5-carboxylate reductase